MMALINEPARPLAAQVAMTIADLNRKRLADSGVFTVSIFGGPGSGKTPRWSTQRSRV